MCKYNNYICKRRKKNKKMQKKSEKPIIIDIFFENK